jgi:ribosomal protein S18 acetylase RimI-like enzyme
MAAIIRYYKRLVLYSFLIHCLGNIIVNDAILIRPATSDDVARARRILFREMMNPLSVSESTMVVAVCSSGIDDDNNLMVGFGQIRSLDDEYSELASLYVDPHYRRQGIGSKIVTSLLARHDNEEEQEKESKRQRPKTVSLLTLRPTATFYEQYGFRVVTSDVERRDLPPSLQFEFSAGSMISKVLNNELVCMIRDKS